MQHLLPLYLVLCLAAGIVSTVVLAAVLSVSRYRPLGWVLAFLVGMGVNLSYNLAMMYQSVNVSGSFSVWNLVMMAATAPFAATQFAAGSLFLHRFLDLPFRRRADLAVAAAAIAHLVLSLSPISIDYSFAKQELVLRPGYVVAQGIGLALVVYTVAISVAFRKRPQDPRHGKLLRFFLAVSAAFLPGFVHDILYFSGSPSIEGMPTVFFFYPLYYMILAVSTSWVGLAWLARPRRGLSEPQSADASERQAAALLRRLEAVGFSRREAELVPLVLEGLANKEIAARLGISVKTVNNHLYSVYRKLKVNSRLGLAARAREMAEPEGQ